MTRNNIVKIFWVLLIISFIILIYNRVLIFGFDSSIVGYKIERIVFWTFIILSFFIYKNTNHKLLIIFVVIFILVTNFLRPFSSYYIKTNYERKITENLYLRESTTIETFPALHIMKRDLFKEQNITLSNSILNNDIDFRSLKEIQKIDIIEVDGSIIILKYEKENKIMLDTFQIIKKNNYY